LAWILLVKHLVHTGLDEGELARNPSAVISLTPLVVKTLQTDFVTSVALDGQVPSGDDPIVAMIGRSNVGKSSLINALTHTRIARSGGKPGTTRLINLYRVRIGPSAGRRVNSFTLADLPGYGYARGGILARQEFQKLTSDFFSQTIPRNSDAISTTSSRLALTMLVVDSRHPGLESDLAAHVWLTNKNGPYVIVTTKNDKMSKTRQLRSKSDHERAFKSQVLSVSNKTGSGINEIWAAIRTVFRD